MADRVTYVAEESAVVGSSHARLTYAAEEAAIVGSPNARVTYAAVEIIVSNGAIGQRGNIDYDQIRASARQGNGSLFQMVGSGGYTTGHALAYDSAGNAIDGGAFAPLVSAPATHSSTGTPGQIAYDGSGNFYWCFATNSWARIGPAGFSTTF